LKASSLSTYPVFLTRGISTAASETPDQPRRREEPPPIEFVKPGEQAPLPPREQPPAAWVPQPEEFQRPPPAWTPPVTRPTGRVGLSRAAGLSLLAAGFLGVASFVISSLTPLPVSDYENLTADPSFYTVNQICGLIVIWSQAAAVLGGIMALQRMNWKLTLVCASLAILTLGFTFEASLLGLIGLILVIVSRREFLS